MATRVLLMSSWRSICQTLPRVLPRITTHAMCTPMSSTSFLATRPFRPHGSVAIATRSSEDVQERKALRLRIDLNSEQLIDEHRDALNRALRAISDIPEAVKRDISLIESEATRLGDGFFMLVVAGEYNSGKSSLINALLGKSVLEEGPTPTTSQVTKLKYSPVSQEPYLDGDGVLVRCEQVDLLSTRLQIVDTPGTNAIDRHHEALTRDFLPLCDIVLFVTSADRPFSESERLFLESIRTWGKKVIMIVNKIDLLETADEQQEVLEFVSSSAQSLLGSESKVFGLSARMAKHAISSSASTNTRQNGSGLDLLEEYIDEKLDSVERFRLKLKASASVGTTLAEKYTSVLSSNQAVVESDRKMLREIDMLLERHEDNVRKAYPAYFARVDNALMNLSERIDFFFNTHTRMSNFWTLSYSSSVEQAFEEEVVKGTSKTIQRQIQAVAEWISDMSSRNLTEVTATFSRRVGERAREISTLREKAEIESEKSSLDFSAFPSGREIEVSSNREGLVTRITERAGDLANDHISGKEGKRIADGIASSVRVSTGLGIGTIGYLAASVVNSSGVALGLAVGDPTVSLLVGTIGVIGATALPRRRRVLRSELKAKIATIRTRLQNDLRGALEDQLSAHMIGIKGIIQPFSDFSEQQVHLLQQRRAGLSDSLEMLKKLQKRSDDMFSPTLDSKEGNEKT